MLKIFHKKFGDSYKTITFVADIRIFSCLFVKFVLYTSGVPWGGSSAFLFIICLSSQGREHSIVPSELNPAQLPPDREP